jgi:Arc/MetJ family transcription regulator
MRTTIDIDDALMAAARKTTGLITKKAIVEEALRLLVRLRAQAEVDSLFGKVNWVGDLEKSRRGRVRRFRVRRKLG